MPHRYFVTGTDTGVGKTQVSCALLELMHNAGHQPAAFKPYESGMKNLQSPGDALALHAASGGWQSLDDVSLFRFKTPVAPLHAAVIEGRPTSFRKTMAAFRRLGKGALVVEGAGGLQVPLDARHDVIDLIVATGLPAILVGRAGLGTINHVTLSVHALLRARVKIAAVVLNNSNPNRDASVSLNRAELERRFPKIRFVGPVPYLQSALRRHQALQKVLFPLLFAGKRE